MPDRPDYPITPLRPRSHRIGGIEFDDPYQWLEVDSPETLAWQWAQDRLAVRRLRGGPAWEQALAAARRFHASVLDHHPPEPHGRWWFREHVPRGARLPVLDVSDTPTGRGRRVVDLAELVPDGPATMLWQPSPNGRLLALSVGGPARPPLFRVIDTATGDVVVDGLPRPGHCRVTWLPDSRRFFAVVVDPARPDGATQVLLVRVTGNAARPEIEPQALPPGFAARRITVCQEGRWALAHGPSRPHYQRDLYSSVSWRPFLRTVPGSFRGTVVGDRFVAVTDDRGPRGRLVAIPLSDGGLDRRRWRELVPPGDAVMSSVTAVGAELVLAEHADGATRLRRIGVDGGVRGEIPLPEPGMVGAGGGRDTGLVAPAGAGCAFVFSSLTRAPTVYRYDFPTSALHRLTRPHAVVDDARVIEATAPGVDGTPIPYKVVLRGDPERGPLPAVIGGHGALNVAWLPAYLSGLPAAWVHLGGIYVHAHLRGGGEYGADWWRAARRRTKQTTVDDLHAIAADLVRRGWTSPDRLGVVGASLGALASVAAITQRPGLYRACVATLPLLDLLRYRQDRATPADAVIADLGDPDTPEDAAVLHSYSPYHQVRRGTHYPAVLLDCAALDRSCPTWHGRKMAARLQAATVGPHPVLLRVRQTGPARENGQEDRLLREAEQLAFLMTELGLCSAAVSSALTGSASVSVLSESRRRAGARPAGRRPRGSTAAPAPSP
ncbi:prolyl oligopeptidase [Streptoalloteichus tenebrarius]|uniref:Prolyl oligopeptidase n=1 Tax=Streptoalloteichus tenebrarius (strain ATCC 17920 / DSM 40477 / JCM 4838 / CBS 697.72 / NBRC 16177 / NCIMB 11028 / NRRL B-12390 / A12253. 1 / ISP 5477) TaxID=1933 RepID=A0ABT1HU46_STRSD|nr:prolyl oligopeptidase family serine peptidase [Streptoalloteichus tenebrarius]MCP2259032.1 prolyl oligopeptidase [Streptoalloteichus tenebrarius]BFE99643.1 prolyl oligopeptidase family serine peptidase [Streptoalloteichus tenebrarius]